MTIAQQQLDAKIAELRDRGYGDRLRFVVNGKKLSIEEAARDELANAERSARNFQDMIATRRAPGLVTDTSYGVEVKKQKLRTLAQQFDGDPTGLHRLLAAAKRQGFVPPQNCTYDPGLAESFGDPAGFVPNHEGRSHIKKVVEKRNRDCEGPVTHRAVQKDPPKNAGTSGVVVAGGKRLAKDIADQMAKRMARRDPKLALASKKEQRQEAAKKYGCD